MNVNIYIIILRRFIAIALTIGDQIISRTKVGGQRRIGNGRVYRSLRVVCDRFDFITPP